MGVSITIRGIPDDVRDELAGVPPRQASRWRSTYAACSSRRPRARTRRTTSPDPSARRRDQGPGRQRINPRRPRRRQAVSAQSSATRRRWSRCCSTAAATGALGDRRADGTDLLAPSLVAFETANIIRHHELAGVFAPTSAAQAHADLLDLAIEHCDHVCGTIGDRSCNTTLSTASSTRDSRLPADVQSAPRTSSGAPQAELDWRASRRLSGSDVRRTTLPVLAEPRDLTGK